MIDFLVSLEAKSEELDKRRPWKVRYSLSTILFVVFVSQLAGIETWKEMEDFIEMNESLLGQYVDLSDGCPSHDTLERVVSMLNPQFLTELKVDFSQTQESATVERLIAIDGKTMRGNGSKTQRPNHIVTAYDGDNRISLGQVVVEEKSNEITAIPRLLRLIDIRKGIVTIDAIGTQAEIVDEIIKGKGDYCLALKGNQGSLHEDIDLYFSDAKLLSQLTEKGCHYQTIEKARSQIEERDYWVSHDVKWLSQRHPKWKKLRGIGMTKNTIDKDGIITEEVRYFILSFKGDVQTFPQVVRGHWSVESLHWLLDVVYREDKNQTLDKRATFNLNAIRKVCLHLLQTMTFPKEKLSYRRKQRYISVHLEDYLPQLFGNRG
ncbi:ISAs1 family transposase [Streptococcus suis]|uniref:ISAs1 family transposase n=1 Tax=Streptococcus suis TaxID=1307 RepID=UPI0004253F1C|nr:ISAs1 family transposase [Streptococcus suis]MBM7283047.1 ISAs1 family transposase [Streptococcus suis]MCO8237183.1 ISAs1 family transposase [Streptococcus suis]HEM3532177.1 ISAs1 family transposase [Streptococcus suis]